MSRFFFRGLMVFFVLSLMSGTATARVSMTSPYEQTDYGTGAGKKLGRGLANVAFGWLVVFKGIKEVHDNNNFIAAVTWGPIYGTGNAVARTVAGAYEVATFPVAAPPYFEPLVQPEFVLDNEG